MKFLNYEEKITNSKASISIQKEFSDDENMILRKISHAHIIMSTMKIKRRALEEGDDGKHMSHFYFLGQTTKIPNC